MFARRLWLVLVAVLLMHAAVCGAMFMGTRLAAQYEVRMECDRLRSNNAAVIEACSAHRERHPVLHALHGLPPLATMIYEVLSFYTVPLVILALPPLWPLYRYLEWWLWRRRDNTDMRRAFSNKQT